MGKKSRLKAERSAQATQDAPLDEAVRAPVSGSVKLVVAFVAAGLVIMFLWSFAYRVQHPSLVQAPRQSSAQSAQGDEHDHDSEDQMKMITGLMQRLKEKPNDVATLSLLGEQFMRMQQWERAGQLLGRALAVEPANTEMLNLLGICDFNLDKFRDAADKFEMIVELKPEDMMARYNLGIIYGHFLNDKAKGRAHLQSVIDSEAVNEETRTQAREELKALQ